MESSILISRAHGETRVAVLEDGVVAEIYVERDDELGLVGGVYKGRVLRVLPGMQAAFVDVGLDKAAFLYVDDVLTSDGESPGESGPEDSLDAPEPWPEAPPAAARSSSGRDAGTHPPRRDPRPPDERPSITQLIREGQEILCQVVKDPLGTKGARVSTYISIPGRHVVLMPTTRHIGVSRRITDEVERKRLKAIIEAHRRPNEGGFIVRTVSTGLEPEAIKSDMELVRSVWLEIKERAEAVPAPALLQADLDLILRATRDLFTRDVSELWVDSEVEAVRIRGLLQRFAPHLLERVHVFTEPESLFDHFGIEPDLERALLKKIPLRSGGSIIIDELEALTAIDVNTGSFVGTRNLEATILKTNLEAAREIVSQLRLRNLGGILVIDFIDMEEESNRDRVFQALTDELARDRAKNHVLPMSGLGIVEMTRKRVRPSLGKILTEPCPYCDGRGRIRSKKSMCREIFREIDRVARRQPNGGILVNAMPEVAAMLTDDESERLLEVEARLGRPIIVEARADLHQEVYQVAARPSSSS